MSLISQIFTLLKLYFPKYAQQLEAAVRDLSPLSVSLETIVMIGVSCYTG